MITLGLFEEMARAEVAGLVKNQNFYWEEMPLQRDGSPAQGVWLVTRQGDISTSRKGLNLISMVDFYVAFSNKVQTESVHQAILDWLLDNKYICELSGTVGGTTYRYSNVRIQPVTSPENSGATDNGTIVKVASARLTYDINNNQ